MSMQELAVPCKPTVVVFLILLLSGCALAPIQQQGAVTNAADAKVISDLPDLNLGELLNYQQYHYQLEDPLGDYALLSLLQLTADDVAWLTLTGQGYDKLFHKLNVIRADFESIPTELDHFQALREAKPEAFNTANSKPWSRNDDVFSAVIRQQQNNGLIPTPGVCHRWSSAYRKHPKTGTFPYMIFSKLFWALAYGDSSVYFVTEKEEQLAQWIIDQPIRSITLQAIFRKSYQLNDGDVYLSILNITNVLSRFWYVDDRETLSIATRLSLITGQQSPEVDNFGAWHHFWGLTLFGYCHGSTSSSLVGWIESLGSSMVTKQDETDEDYINRYAGQVGVELRKKIELWPVEYKSRSNNIAYDRAGTEPVKLVQPNRSSPVGLNSAQ
jgi:hypothetical protein